MNTTAQQRLHRVLPFRALGGPCSIELYAEHAAQLDTAIAAAQAEVLRIEAKYSRYRADSIVSRINAAAGSGQAIAVDEETAALLDYAATAHAQSEGRFDISSGILRRAWDFRSGRLPASEDIERLLPLVGWQQVHWQRPAIALPQVGMELDFGGFGKEYAVDRVVALLRGQGIRHGLVDLGGDLGIVGPHPDGSPWRVGIRHPRAPVQAVASLDVAAGAVATSGDYERYLEVDGRRYAHILDPRSGWPVPGPASVSVIASSCLIAGTATTIAMLHGAAAADWLHQLDLPWLLLSADGSAQGSLASAA
jgi:thiamine biosynthesis lipoprotein